jgi:hypothetical protein
MLGTAAAAAAPTKWSLALAPVHRHWAVRLSTVHGFPSSLVSYPNIANSLQRGEAHPQPSTISPGDAGRCGCPIPNTWNPFTIFVLVGAQSLAGWPSVLVGLVGGLKPNVPFTTGRGGCASRWSKRVAACQATPPVPGMHLSVTRPAFTLSVGSLW